MTTGQTALSLSLLISLLCLAGMAATAIAAALRAGGRRDDPPDSHPAVSGSRFTIPVSVILPVTRASASLSGAIAAALALNYPELEVIVVVDSGKNADVDALTREWQLQAREFFYRRTIETAPVQRIYRSQRDSRVMVIDKTYAGYSDALNCGINVARYRYVVSLSVEVVFDPDALLRLMTPALRDPAAVVGVGHHVERRGAFERPASVRSLMESKLAWSGRRCGLGPSGGVAAWRRDAVLKMRGFSRSAADPDLDMMFRLQASGEGSERFDRSANVFGWIDSESFGGTLERAGRRQRAALGVLVKCLLGGAGALDARTLIVFLTLEVLAPLAQAWLVVGTVWGAAAGWFPWTAPVWMLLLLCFGNSSMTAAAPLLRGAGPGAPETRELKRLLAAGPFEFVVVRSALAGARLAGVLAFGARPD